MHRSKYYFWIVSFVTLSLFSPLMHSTALAQSKFSPLMHSTALAQSKPTPTITKTPTKTATPVASKVAVLKSANLRGGPGTNYKVVGGVKAGQLVSVVGKNAKGDWYKLATEEWIAAFLVTKPVDVVPVVGADVVVAKATATPTAVARSAKATATSALSAKGVTSEEGVYLLGISKALDSYATGLGAVGQRFTQAGKNPVLLFSDDWKIQVAAAFVMIKWAGDDLREMTPPDRLSEMHDNLMLAAEHYDLAVKYATEGIDEFDMDKLSMAATEINTGQIFFDAALTLFNEFKELTGA